jgi:hypothetical protein
VADLGTARYDSVMTDLPSPPESMRTVRRLLRQLPRDRQREIATSIREGRAVKDPRDAPLAAAWAERLVASAPRVPSWLLPLTRRPQGWRAWAWLFHLVWIVAVLAYVYYQLWNGLSGVWRWVLLGFLAYTVLTMPLTFRTIRRMLRAYWNAPEAAKKNRELAERP